MRRRAYALVGTVLALAILPAPARGAPVRAATPARLVYLRGSGAERCPDQDALRGAVRARLGYDPFSPSAGDTLLVEIRRRDGIFRTTIRLLDADERPRGERTISLAGSDCSAAVGLLGLTISLTLDASTSLAGQAPTPPRAPTPAETPRPAPPLAVVSVMATDQKPPRSWSPYVGVAVVGSIGAAPAPTAGVTIAVGAAWRALSLDLEGRADLPATGGSDVGTARVRSSLLTASVVPCLHYGPAFGCPVVSGGIIVASALNVATVQESHGPWSALGGRLGTEWAATSRLHVRIAAEVLALLTRDTFWIDATRVYTVRPWTGALSVGALWRFW